MTSRRLVRTAAVVVAAGVAVVACGGSAADDSTATVPQATQQATEQAAEPVTDAPAGSDDNSEPAGDAPEILRFTSPLVGGGELDAAELSGKPTAFWFWSPT